MFSVLKWLKLFAGVVGLWGILGGLFSMSLLTVHPQLVGQGRRMLSWEVGRDPSLHRDCCIPPAP